MANDPQIPNTGRPQHVFPRATLKNQHVGPKRAQKHLADCTCTPCLGAKEALTLANRAGWTDLEPQTKFDEVLQETPATQLGPLYVDLPPLERQDKSARARVTEYLAYRTAGVKTQQEIAEKMGIARRTLQTLLWRAGKEGWLVYTDPTERFEQEIIPHVVDNIAHFIKQKDRTMTIEAAKGAGIFKSHQAVKVESDQPQTVLALKIETAPQMDVKVAAGQIVGTPRGAEAL